MNLVNHLYKAVSVAKKYYPSSNFVSIPEDVLHPSTKKNIYSRPNLKIAEQPIAILSFYSINFQNCRTTSLMTPASTRALSIKSSVKGLNAHLNVILLLLHSLMKSRISWRGEDDTFQDLSRHRRIMSMCIGTKLALLPPHIFLPRISFFPRAFFSMAASLSRLYTAWKTCPQWSCPSKIYYPSLFVFMRYLVAYLVMYAKEI